MNPIAMTYIEGPVVEEEVRFTLVELCQACSAEEEHVLAWVFEGVLEPAGSSPQDWRFSGESLRRARLALRLSQDLEINPPGVALALDLLDEIAALRARLQRAGVR
ncbi:chaperone modulator CbpM [Sulfuritalea sp.]|uniref:chaperone modulator CbpM n=1 Tax=Sulfuritalea sp. TaxID=2480090 RepID=UPI00286DCA98|nr:chaperone modulator CbpM [Sulfuritalea sp.]